MKMKSWSMLIAGIVLLLSAGTIFLFLLRNEDVTTIIWATASVMLAATGSTLMARIGHSTRPPATTS